MSDERERNPLDGPANGPSSSGQTPDDPGTGEPQPVELLSAYLDDDPDLDPALRDDLEARLEDDAGLRQVYAEMDVIRQGLRELPGVPAPRNYHVTPGMLGIPEPAVLYEREPWYERHSGGLRWATSLAAILFVFVLSADLVVNSLSGPGGDSDDADTSTSSQLRTSDADGGDDTGEAADGAESGGDEADIAPASGAQEANATETETIAADSAPPVEEEEEADAESEAGSEPATADAYDDAAPTAADDPAQDRDDAAVDEPAPEEPEVQSFAQEPDAAGESAAPDEDGDGSLRVWRIVEFGLVAVLGVLLTATVVLPRLGARGHGSR